MKLLLISDTHGSLENINRIAEKVQADAVIHCGDLGFYDAGSAERLSDREINLCIVHSSLPGEEINNAANLSRDAKISLIKERNLLSELPAYLEGEKQFTIPIYTVWGNHEDIEVVKKFRDGEYRVENLFLLDENNAYDFNDIHIYGLGGNLLTSKKFFQKPLAGGGGKIWSTFSQYQTLINRVDKAEDKKKRLFVSHVSPGKEAFISLVGALIRADFILSGHMGAPFNMLWNEFSVQDAAASVKRIVDYLEELKDVAAKADENIEHDIEVYKKQLNEHTVKMSRGRIVPEWYIKMYSLNLPDFVHGYSILNYTNGRMQIEPFSMGIT